MGIFRTLASALVVVMFFYVAHQLTRFTDFSWQGQSLIVFLLAALFAIVIGTFLYFWKEKSLDHNPRRDAFMNVALTTMAYINFLVSLVLIRDVFAFIENLGLNLISSDNLYSSQATLFLLGAPIALLGLGNLVVRVGPRLTKVTIPSTRLPLDLEGLRIIHVTDLHVSPSLPPVFVDKLVKSINELKADMVVFTGDILDSFREKHERELKSLGNIKSRLGTYYVPGNHEYYWNGPNAIQAFRDIGFHVLLNRAENIAVGSSTLQMIGIPDPAAAHFQQEGPDFQKVAAQLHQDSFKILLSHQPSLAAKSEAIGVDIQLSGHTHGGQFFPWNWLIVFFERYAKGLYRIGKLQLYVNQGTGYWGPRLRLGTFCELTEIILRKADKTG